MVLRKHNALFHFSLEIERDIVNLYVNKYYSITKIAKRYAVDRDTISRLLKRNNIKLHKLGSHLRKYSLNEHYFDNINSEDTAYFLGLLYADGCNHLNKVDIDLQEQDKEILSIFSKYLYEGNEFLQYIDGRNGYKNKYRLTISSKTISQQLNKLGCVAQKSLILQFPDWLINPILQRHFIRGYFDGDGSISRYKRGNNYDYNWSLVSTKIFCDKVSDIIEKTCKIHICDKLTCPNTSDITNTIYIRGYHQILQVMGWLYQDATIYLERKYQKYLLIKRHTEE